MPARQRSAGRSRRAVVVGGGIGGLTQALVLRRAGWEVVVLESRPELGEVDTGFGLWSFAIKRLRALGLGDGLDRIGEPITRLVHRSWRGGGLTDVSLEGLNARLGTPTYDVHRAGLQALLADAVGQDAIRLGERCIAVRGEDEPLAVLESGERLGCDLLVGADGVNSVVRRHVAGDVRIVRPDAAVWRGVAEVDTDLVPHGWHIRVMGPASLFGVGRLDERQVRWYAGAFERCEHPPPGPARKRQIEERFGHWPSPAAEVIAATAPESVLLNDAPRACPLRRWTLGSVALLGDAAHAMLPTLGTGGGMAIEDAWVLGECLAAEADPQAALAPYERRRRRPVRRTQREALTFAGVLVVRRAPLLRAREIGFRRLERLQARVIEHLMHGDGRWRRRATAATDHPAVRHPVEGPG